MKMFMLQIISVLSFFIGLRAENLTVGHDGFILNFPKVCEPTSWEIEIDDEGLGLLFKVENMTLDSDNEAYLALSTDAEMSGDISSVTYFSGNLTNITFAVPLVKTVYLNFSSKIPCSLSQEFTLNLTQYANASIPIPSLPPDPNPPGDIPTAIIVHFSGKTLNEFNSDSFQSLLTDELKRLAIDFCKKNKINYIEGKPSNETVFFNSTKNCPESWHDYKKCVSTRMAIYVSPRQNLYELSIPHLRQFWEEIEESGIGNLPITAYDFPSISSEILWWILWISIAVLSASVAGLIYWRIEVQSQRLKQDDTKRKQQARKEILSGVPLRNRVNPYAGLPTHQKLPEFMIANADGASQTSTPPTTKKHPLKSIMKLNTGTESVESDESINSPAPDWKTTPSFFFNDGFAEDEETEEELDQSNSKDDKEEATYNVIL